MSTRQQRWSLAAHQAVLRFAKQSDETKKKMKTWCMKMPALIQRSGTVQALTFIQARGKDGKQFADAFVSAYQPDQKVEALLKRAQKAGLPAYLALTRDLLEVATWFRRFAQIELADVKGEE